MRVDYCSIWKQVDEGPALERTQGVGFVFECAHVSIFSDLDPCESHV